MDSTIPKLFKKANCWVRASKQPSSETSASSSFLNSCPDPTSFNDDYDLEVQDKLTISSPKFLLASVFYHSTRKSPRTSG